MKRFFAIISTILVLAACSNEGLIDSPNTNDGRIKFGDVSTRAAVSNASDITEFGVMAEMNLGADDTPEALQWVPLLENERVYRGSDNNFTYDNTRYWVEDRTFRFFAYYPYLIENKDAAADGLWKVESTTSASGSGNYELSYVTPAEANSDLLASNTNVRILSGGETEYPTYPTVDVTFEHLVTSVGLKIWRDGGKHQNDQMRITKVTLGNIRKSGTYSSQTETWTPNSDKMDFEKIYTIFADTDNIGAAVVENNGLTFGGNPPADPFGTMLLLPQALDASNLVSLKIEYELKRQNAADWEPAELETNLPAITWAKNKQYTYNVVLSQVTDITIYYIQTKVDPWGTPQVGGTVIIK